MKFQPEEFYSYYIRILFESLEEELVFPIRSIDIERLQSALEAKQKDFFIFSTPEDYDVAINLSAIQFLNIICESLNDQLDESKRLDPQQVRIHFRGKKNITESGGAEPIEWPGIFMVLESISLLEDNNLQTYEDEDGETVIFDAYSVLYLEIASSLIKEGYEELDKDMRKGDNDSGK